MTIEEQILRFEELEQQIIDGLPEVLAQIAGGDFRAMIVKRVTETATGANGNKFSDYSSTPTYINTSIYGPRKVDPKGKTGKTVFAKTGEKHKSTYFPLGYLEYRSKIGRELEKNFFLTGEMWRNFGITKVTEDGNEVTVTLAGLTPDAQNKIDGNSEREGQSIIEANEEEIRFIEDNIMNWIIQLTEQAIN